MFREGPDLQISSGAIASVPFVRANALASVLADEQSGAVVHIYREIARRIARNAFTSHASRLGEALS